MVRADAGEGVAELVALGYLVGGVTLGSRMPRDATVGRTPRSIPAKDVQARVHSDPPHPRLEFGGVVETPHCSPRAEKRFLRSVLGELVVSDDEPREGAHGFDVPLCEGDEGLLVTSARSLD